MADSTDTARATIAELRRRYRRFRWSSQRTLRGKAVVGARVVLRPLLAALVASALVVRHGGTVARRHGVSRLQQLARMWWLRSRHGLEPEWYYHFRLFLPEEWERADLYLRVSEVRELLILIRSATSGDRSSSFSDKRTFEQWCASFGFPALRTLLVIGEPDPAPPRRLLPPHDLFTKPAALQGGRGARRWRYADGGWIGDDGARRDERALLAELEAQSVALTRPIIVQRCLTNHPELAGLTSGGLGTARLVTSRSLDGAVEPRHAIYKMPIGGSPIDNFQANNLAAPVDLASGRLGTATRMEIALLGDRIERHPDTGALIEGTRLPHWHELVSLALRAHAAIEEVMPFVGWDIAITVDGPILVEGNVRPGAPVQLIHRVPLGETRFATLLLEYLRAYAP